MRTMHTLPIIITVTMVATAFTIPWIRLRCEQHRMAGLTMARATPPANASGIGSVIAAIIARTASGGSALEAFQEQFGARFATPRITTERIAMILRRHASDDDTEHDITRIAGHLASACALSERLGCEVHRCLQSVSDSYRRECKARDLRKEAFAAPQATIRLMSVLPPRHSGARRIHGSAPDNIPVQLAHRIGLPCCRIGLVRSRTAVDTPLVYAIQCRLARRAASAVGIGDDRSRHLAGIAHTNGIGRRRASP